MTLRRETINDIVQSKGEISISELEVIFPDVSSMTIRRDLESLEKAGKLVRVYGGAKSIKSLSRISEEKYTSRVLTNIDEKMEIARKAIKLLQPNTSLYIDSGSTTMCFAQMIPDEHYFITTSGLNIAYELTKNSNMIINIIGGEINKDSLTVASSNAIKAISRINIDIAFMATTGFSFATGFSNANHYECELKKSALARARRKVILMDSDKLNHNLPYIFAQLGDIDTIITDSRLDDDIFNQLVALDIEVL